MGGRVGPRVGSGRVRLFVGNRGSGQRFAGSGRVGSKKSDPWTTLVWRGGMHNKLQYRSVGKGHEFKSNMQVDLFFISFHQLVACVYTKIKNVNNLIIYCHS